MTKFVDAKAIEWSRYPYVARSEHARAWIGCEVFCGKSNETVEKRARVVKTSWHFTIAYSWIH